MKTIENLTPVNSQKSFYGKAKVIYTDDGAKLLKSYNTIVAEIDSKGNFSRRWYGWSATTAKHINSFRETFGLPSIRKADWCKMEVV